MLTMNAARQTPISHQVFLRADLQMTVMIVIGASGPSRKEEQKEPKEESRKIPSPMTT